MTEELTTEQVGHILKICINRPDKGNAFNWNILRGLAEAYTELSDNPDLRCGVVYASGKNFSGGLDFMDMAPRMINDDLDVEGLVNPLRLDREGADLREATKPVIVAVHGRCYTAGLELALAADIIVAGTDTIFAQSEVRRGVYPMGGATFRLPGRIGWHNAMKIMLTGDPFDADEAYRLGLVQELCDPDKVLEVALQLAERIASAAPLGVQATLNNARVAEKEGPLAASRQILPGFQTLFGSADTQEGLASIFEKRDPVFTGK